VLINAIELIDNQVINHGMDIRLLEELIEVGKQFFALPLKEKLKWSTKDEQLMQGYGSDSGLAGEQILCWHDRLFLTLYPEESRMPKFWPHEPYKFRYVIYQPNPPPPKKREKRNQG